jgi:hypothetical protein
MSGVIGALLEGAEMGDDTAIADDELRTLMAPFATPFTPVCRCWKHAKKPATLCHFLARKS